jgi:hypothetical protein
MIGAAALLGAAAAWYVATETGRYRDDQAEFQNFELERMLRAHR